MNNVTDYRANGYERALELAKQSLRELDVEIIFKSKTICKKKRIFEYESIDEVSNASKPEKYFIKHVFKVILDNSINSLLEIFELLKRYNGIWGLLKDLKDFLEKNDSK